MNSDWRDRLDRAYAFLLDRLDEGPTWAGIVMLLSLVSGGVFMWARWSFPAAVRLIVAEELDARLGKRTVPRETAAQVGSGPSLFVGEAHAAR